MATMIVTNDSVARQSEIDEDHSAPEAGSKGNLAKVMLFGVSDH